MEDELFIKLENSCAQNETSMELKFELRTWDNKKESNDFWLIRPANSFLGETRGLYVISSSILLLSLIVVREGNIKFYFPNFINYLQSKVKGDTQESFSG